MNQSKMASLRELKKQNKQLLLEWINKENHFRDSNEYLNNDIFRTRFNAFLKEKHKKNNEPHQDIQQSTMSKYQKELGIKVLNGKLVFTLGLPHQIEELSVLAQQASATENAVKWKNYYLTIDPSYAELFSRRVKSFFEELNVTIHFLVTQTGLIQFIYPDESETLFLDNMKRILDKKN